MTACAGRSGFVAVVGRPNVGKSTLVNRMVGTKVTITAPSPNTTRRRVRGVVNRPGVQAVLVDTPGLHRPRTALGGRLNESALEAFDEVDEVLAVVEATAAVGPGDRMVLSRSVDSGLPLAVAVNKIDRARPDQVLERLASVAAVLEEAGRERGAGEDQLVGAELFPVAATTGEGVPDLVEHLIERLPEGPPLYPPDMVSDQPEAWWVAELVREQLLARAREELPHSIACRVTEWEEDRVRCEILVERRSQKAIVIGRHGEVLKEVGTAVRRHLPPGTFLELVVKVEPRWQRRREVFDRLDL